MRAARTIGLLSGAVIAAAVVSGCGSSGGGSTGGLSAAQQARSEVVSAAQALSQRMVASGLGADNGTGQPGLTGQYTSCASSGSQLYYGTYFELSPVSPATGSGGAYKNQVSSAMTGAGWSVKPVASAPALTPFSFDVSKSGITGQVQAVSHSNAVTVAVTLKSSCVDAGSSASSLEANPKELLPLHPTSSAAPTG